MPVAVRVWLGVAVEVGGTGVNVRVREAVGDSVAVAVGDAG